MYQKFINLNGNPDYSTSNYYEFDIQTGSEMVVAEGFHNVYEETKSPFGFIYAGPNFEFVVSHGRASDLPEYIDANGDIVFFSYYVGIRSLLVSPFKPSIVYAPTVEHGVMISHDGGVTWPDSYEVEHRMAPDSAIMDFPLISISPDVDRLVFGHDRENNQLLRSEDNGETSIPVLTVYEPSSPLLYTGTPGQVAFVAHDRRDWTFTLYVSSKYGAQGTWEQKATYNTHMELATDSQAGDTLYVWNTRGVQMSTDFGKTFSTLYASPEDEFFRRFTAEQGRWFFQMPDHIFEWDGQDRLILTDLPVSNEDTDIFQPQAVSLSQNYPNPFNPSATIRFQLPVAQNVTIQVFDLSGRQVGLIAKGKFSAGTHSAVFLAEGLASGIYLVRAQLGDVIETRKITLIK